jgi:cytoskeletal protein CcmA (bactofilin family)
VFGKRKNDEPVPAKPQPAPAAPEAVRAEPEAIPEETSPADAPVPPDFKESPMARSPFAPPPIPAAPTPSPVPARATITSMPAREVVDRRTLVVGRGISVQGTVQDAERLVVEGTVEATSINGLTELSIAHGGVFKGEVEVEEAEIAGTIDGTLVARQTLVVRSTGRVLGTARCRRLQVEDGGQITGRIEMLGESSSSLAAEGGH